MNRRSFFKAVAGAAGLVVVSAPSVAEAAEEVSRKYWSLDRSMVVDVWEQDFIPDKRAIDMFARWWEAMEPREYPITEMLMPQYPELNKPYDQVTYEWGQSYYPLANGQHVTIYGREPYSDRLMNMPRREVLSHE